MSDMYLVSPKEIAAATGKSVRFINMRATDEQWDAEIINKRGDRRFYVDSLPEDVRMALHSHSAKNIMEYNNPSAIKQTSETKRLCDWQVKQAAAWMDLLRLYLEYVKKKAQGYGTIGKIKEEFERAYNAGAYPEIFKILGRKNLKTIEKRVKIVKDGCPDPLTEFAPKYGSNKGKRSINAEQAEVIFSIVRSPYQPKRKSEIIRIARAVMDQKGIDDGLSDATYRRYLDEWIETHFDEWIFWREGEKGLHNKCLYWIERDYDKIDVGDILVADGHTLNFETLNPWTGKAKRMTLILWYDMKSNFPCGWEIMPSENTQAISAALRRGIIMLGKVPKIAYLDNGKAFRARFFRGCSSFEESGLSGIYERLDIKTIFAWPYHPQSKTVERFFEIFAELERIAPSYVGTSIAEKPPRLHLGEKMHRRIHEKITGGQVPTLEETHRAIAAWFDEYARRPQQSGHLKGKRPIDVFMEGKGPGVDRHELRELMMSMEVRTIRRRGIKMPWGWYYHPAMYGRKHEVIVKYDLQDKNSILVYRDEELICEAKLAEKVHPAAEILGTEEDKALLNNEIALKKRLEKKTLTGARELLNTVVIPETTKQIENAGFSLAENSKIKAEKKGKVRHLPLSDEAKARIERDYEELERIQEEMDQINWNEMAGMSDMDRYEKLLEYEARNILIPRDEMGFMRYFEQTEQYSKFADYFDEHRAKMVMMFQS